MMIQLPHAHRTRVAGTAVSILVICGAACRGAVMDVDETGLLDVLRESAQANVLAGKVRMRIVERQFVPQDAAKQPSETTEKTVVANQLDLFADTRQPAVERAVRLVIDDAAVAPRAIERDTTGAMVTKTDAAAELDWSTRFAAKGNGLELAVTFHNRSDRLRSLDVEFPIPLVGTDYAAFFPGANDFPEWPEDGAVAYQLRAIQWDYNRLSQPLATFFAPKRDTGISIAASYARPVLPITFFAARSDTHTAVLATFVRVRLDPGGERTIRLYLVPHTGDWRGGLAFVREAFPGTFYVDPAVARFFTHSMGGSCGDYFNRHLDQVRRMFEDYPDLDGFFVDQCYGAAGHVYAYDDGYTVTDDGRTAGCFNSNLAGLTAAARELAHAKGKFVWGNHGYEVIDLAANYDLTLCEDRMSPGHGQEPTRYATSCRSRQSASAWLMRPRRSPSRQTDNATCRCG